MSPGPSLNQGRGPGPNRGRQAWVISSEANNSMASDPRDELWKACFETYYDTYFQEVVADGLINHWQRVDEVTRVLVAITASGSAVSGWALWTRSHFRGVWVLLAGAAALLAIVHAALGISDRLKYQGELKRRFSGLRTELETFRYRMCVDTNFPVDKFTVEFGEFRRRYSDAVQLLRNDLLLTRSFEIRRQRELNERLRDEIEEPI